MGEVLGMDVTSMDAQMPVGPRMGRSRPGREIDWGGGLRSKDHVMTGSVMRHYMYVIDNNQEYSWIVPRTARPCSTGIGSSRGKL